MKQPISLNLPTLNNSEDIFNYIYLNYGIYTAKDKKILFKVRKNTFAGEAWTISDEAYNDIIGSKFIAITGDDNRVYNLDRTRVKRLSSVEQFFKLLRENCCKEFINDVHIDLYVA
jgi:hypothetical protein